MPRKQTPTPAATAYSYLRFSNPEQAKGDSLRRQTERRDEWLKRSGATLDTTLSLRDMGVSAFNGSHRQNPDRHALATFLDLVKRGRIRRGSYLVVEALDRLSREDIRPALTLLLNLIDSGVRVVQLLPVETVYDENVEPMALMMAIMELSRGHSESQMKSDRVGDAWEEKKRVAAEDRMPITRRAPAWLRVEGGRFVVDEERADAVRRVYRMAVDGHGLSAITTRLNAERVPTIGPADYWARSYVAKLLWSRVAVGEYQPYTRRGGKRRPHGQPIQDYYPKIITEDQWHAAQAALHSRLNKGGQGGKRVKRVNLFANLLHDARGGDSVVHVKKGKKGGKDTDCVLIPYKGINGVAGTRSLSFPAEVFEQAVLSCLREIDPREILPQADGATDRVLSLTGKRADLLARVEKIKGQIVDGGEIASLVDVLRKLEARLAEAEEALAEAKRQAASPVSVTWGEYGSLVDALEAAPDPEEARVRLRSALRRMVESVWCLFVARGARRIAAVQVYFPGGQRRDYLVLHQPATGGAVGDRPARWWVRSLAGMAKPGELDLRKPAHARRLEAALAALEPATLDAGAAG